MKAGAMAAPAFVCVRPKGVLADNRAMRGIMMTPHAA
jgi:hypothetical protein